MTHMTYPHLFPESHFVRLLAVGLFCAGLCSARAADEKAASDATKAAPPREETVVTTHTVTIDGREIAYKAVAGTILIKSEDKGKTEPKASVFYIAYTRTGDDSATTASRPITFSFNGGPGSSSVWLHLGLLGPRRVELDDDGHPPAPPYALTDNAFSLLDLTDLVFIDPVSTGYSRVAPGEDPGQFHGVNEDIRSVGEFIRVYVTRRGRWSSPKYLIGESYGTTRAAGLAGHLQNELGMYLNGIMLVSTVLDFQTVSFAPNNQLPYLLFLPTYSATAWYHKRLPADLQSLPLGEVMDRAEQFAMNDYAPALLKGDALPDADRARIAGQLARYTGLSEDYIQRNDLRVPIWRFTKELLRDRRRTVGRFDSRYTGIDRDAAGEATDFDPSYAALLGPYTATMNDYLRGELNYTSDLPYEILTGNVRPWNYGDYQNQYLDVADTLRAAIHFNPHLRVFLAAGLYDLATPSLAASYTVDHLRLDPELRGNVSLATYEAGHMMYVHRPSLEKMRNDLAAFISGVNPAP
jgi:carboxypeptidase C (cathepsin A)